MRKEEIERYEQYLAKHKDKMQTRVFGSYLRYLDRYLHDKEKLVDGRTWEEIMEHEPLPKNIYLYG